MKKQSGILFLFFSVICHVIYSQVTFQKAYGTAQCESGNSVEITADGGFISAGQKMNPSVDLNYYRGYLLRTTTDGNIIWAKNYFINNGGGFFAQAIQTSDKGFIATGVQYDSTGGSINANMLLVKTDSAGNVVWSKIYGGPAGEDGAQIIQTPDGGYVSLGETYTVGSSGNVNVYIIKTDASGNVLWSHIYGGSGFDKCFTIRQTSDGGFFTVGLTYNFGAANGDIYALKLDSLGNIVWSKTYGESSYDGAADGIQTSDGGYMIAANTSSYGAASPEINLIKINSAGDTLWTKIYSKPGITQLNVWSVIQTSDLNYVLSGYAENTPGHYDAYLLKVNSNGNCLWANADTAIGTEFFYNARETADNGLIISAVDGGYFGMGNDDLMLIKTDVNGNSGCYQHPDFPVVSASNPTVINVSTPVSSVSLGSNPVTVIAGNDNSSQTNICYSAVTSVASAENKLQITVYPNPATTTLNIENITGNTTIELYDMLGELVLEKKTEHTTQIDIRSLAEGIYTIMASNSKEKMVTKIVIVK